MRPLFSGGSSLRCARDEAVKPALLLGLAFAVGVTTPSGSASAAEKSHHLALAPIGALLKVKDQAVSVGGGASAMYTYGLTDQLNLMAEVSHSFVGIGQHLGSLPPGVRPGFVSTGAAGISYVLDVLRWVPYGGVLLSGNAVGGGNLPNAVFAPGGQLALGLDYQFSRHVVAGVGFRQHLFFTKLSEYPSYSTFFLKAEWQWGY